MNRKKILIVFFTAVLVISIGIIACNKHRQDNKTAYIYKDGELVKTVNLNTAEETITIGENGENVALAENGRICMKYADCPDKICVNSGWIYDSSVPIVCLPNKVIIKIK